MQGLRSSRDVFLNSPAPAGRPARRYRSEGRLNLDDVAWYRAQGIDLGFDPVLNGYVPVSCIDDIADASPVPVQPKRSPAKAAGSLAFRRWGAADAPIFLQLLGNERVWRYIPEARPNLDLETAADLIALSNGSDHHDVYAVVLDGKVVGQARLLFEQTAAPPAVAEISYWLGEPFWGRGIGSRIVQQFTLESFKRWPTVQTITARVHEDNTASLRALSKAGYTPAARAAEASWLWFQMSRPEAGVVRPHF